jgi:gluconolactonase
VTDTTPTDIIGPGPGESRPGSTVIYRFKLDADCNPTNKIMFAMPRSGTSDGLHVDNDGRLWSAEYNSIVVRSSRGKGLSVFNVEQLVKDWEHSNPIVNFALAGDKLVVLAGRTVWLVHLGMNVTTPAEEKS